MAGVLLRADVPHFVHYDNTVRILQHPRGTAAMVRLRWRATVTSGHAAVPLATTGSLGGIERSRVAGQQGHSAFHTERLPAKLAFNDIQQCSNLIVRQVLAERLSEGGVDRR